MHYNDCKALRMIWIRLICIGVRARFKTLSGVYAQSKISWWLRIPWEFLVDGRASSEMRSYTGRMLEIIVFVLSKTATCFRSIMLMVICNSRKLLFFLYFYPSAAHLLFLLLFTVIVLINFFLFVLFVLCWLVCFASIKPDACPKIVTWLACYRHDFRT